MTFSNIRKPVKFISGFSLFALLIMYVFWIRLLKTQEVNTSNPIEQSVIHDSIEVFRLADRCDPLPCTDRFFVMNIELLSESANLKNTGAAKLLIGSTNSNNSGIRIIESSRRLRSQEKGELGRCYEGEYLLKIKQFNFLYMPLDTIRICYSSIQGNTD
ncbi:MAG: hypothetical protein H6657_14725 [Ardenticatenaceae bacterium]|nr:hypothetical protein [Ardenticatenaceae bacterium]